MKRIPLLATALFAAALLPGCYAARKGIPLDASGMAVPGRYVAGQLEDQTRRTRDSITGLPRTLDNHFRECWRHITEDPSR